MNEKGLPVKLIYKIIDSELPDIISLKITKGLELRSWQSGWFDRWN
jgi:hypothetical protein